MVSGLPGLPELPDTEFWRAWQGGFQGVLRWGDLDALLQVLAQSGGAWFVWDMEEGAPPDRPAPPATLAGALDAVREINAPVRARSYCGTVYVDDPAAPAFVKAFDPYKMGATCGSSGERTMPRFVFSRIRPEALVEPEEEVRTGLWRRLRGAG